jgi:hypothetical protein
MLQFCFHLSYIFILPWIFFIPLYHPSIVRSPSESLAYCSCFAFSIVLSSTLEFYSML